LLRSLGNPVELKRDPLAARLVGRSKSDPAAVAERADRLAAVLRASLESMCSHAASDRANDRMRRAARIIERCDLGGRPHETVALEIGLARRQFYRDRALALDALALELDDLLAAATPHVAAIVDASRLAFETSEMLVGIGKYDDAEALLAHVEASTRDPDDRLRAAARLVEAACESGERTRTQRALERARGAGDAIAAAGTLARVRFELSLALADDALAVAASGERRLALLDELRSRPDSSDERWEVLALGLAHRATAAHTKGDFATALASLHEAEAVLRRCESAPFTLPALLPNLIGVTLMMLPQSLDVASQQHKRAISLGRPRGLMRIVVASMLNDCAIDLWQGRARQVCDRAMATLETARAVTGREEFGRLAILVSKVALGAGRLGDALALLEEVRISGDEFPRLAPRAILAKAQALLHAGEFERASAAARDALRATRRSGESALVGTALLLDAEALAGTRQAERARKALDEALIVLRETGSAHVLGRARRLAQQLSAQ
jgi:tetratricopeptide (TPR) repeat protein